MNVFRKNKRKAQKETSQGVELFKDEESGLVVYLSKFGKFKTVGIFSEDQYANLLTFAEEASFLALTDTPDSYSGNGTKVVSVKAGEDGLEFTTISTPTDTNFANTDLTFIGNRVHDADGYDLTVTDVGLFSIYGVTYLDEQIALNMSTTSGAMIAVKEKSSIGGFAMILQDSDGLIQFQVGGQQVHVSNNKVRFLRSGENYLDVMEDNLIVRTDVSGAVHQALIFKNNGVLNAPSMPIGNGGRVAGDFYMDTAANALANGDLIIIQKQ